MIFSGYNQRLCKDFNWASCTIQTIQLLNYDCKQVRKTEWVVIVGLTVREQINLFGDKKYPIQVRELFITLKSTFCIAIISQFYVGTNKKQYANGSRKNVKYCGFHGFSIEVLIWNQNRMAGICNVILYAWFSLNGWYIQQIHFSTNTPLESTSCLREYCLKTFIARRNK